MSLREKIKNILFVNEKKYGWSGDYPDWESAKKETSGYDMENILEKVSAALLLVKKGNAAYERDSVLYNKVEYSFPLLASLMHIAAKNEGRLNVIDFGGSLGSTYFQNKIFLDELKELHWNIVEQPNYVARGKQLFENDILKFYNSIEECLKIKSPDVIIFSSVLQYLEKPHDFIDHILSLKIPNILIDLTGFVRGNRDRLTIQRVPPEIYEASYPCWFFNKEKFLAHFTAQYDLLTDFPGFVGSELCINDNIRAGYEGFILKIKNM
jgi:putative methyltransferase (TIGR04325 family)